MISFDDFIAKYTNKYVDLDNAYGAQCMDLMHAYVIEVLGLEDKSILAAPTAYQAYLDAGKWSKYFEKIPNTPLGVPKKGDIFFFNTKVGSAGHVCIYISGGVLSFTSFDQNWPVGTACHKQSHNYSGAAGWLRFIPQPTENKYEVALKQIKDIVDKLV